MPETIELSREQVVFLVLVSALGNIIYSHTWINDAAGRAAWVVGGSGILLLIPCVIWLLYLGKRHPQNTLFDILEANLGKIPCAIAGVIYILLNIAVATTMLNLFTHLLKTFFMIFTPVWIIMFFLILVAVLFVGGGFKAFARTVELLTILGLVNYFISFIFAFPSYIHIEYIIPIFDTTLSGFIKSTLFMAGAASECLLMLLIIMSYIPDPGKHYPWAIYGLIYGAVILSSAILIIAAMMSPELAKRIAFGGVNAATLIQIGEFLQGLEVFIFGTYQFLAIGKLSICLHCIWTASQKLLNNWQPKTQLVLAGLLILIPSVWLNSYNKAYQLAVFLGYIMLPFALLLLLLASLGIILKNKRSGSNVP